MAKATKDKTSAVEEDFQIFFTENAEKDIIEIHDYIAKENPRTAITIVRKIRTKANTLDHFPFRGSYVPELLAINNKNYRQITEPPWRIIYKVDGNAVNILAIVDSRRDLNEFLIDRFLYRN